MMGFLKAVYHLDSALKQYIVRCIIEPNKNAKLGHQIFMRHWYIVLGKDVN